MWWPDKVYKDFQGPKSILDALYENRQHCLTILMEQRFTWKILFNQFDGPEPQMKWKILFSRFDGTELQMKNMFYPFWWYRTGIEKHCLAVLAERSWKWTILNRVWNEIQSIWDILDQICLVSVYPNLKILRSTWILNWWISLCFSIIFYDFLLKPSLTHCILVWLL